MTTKWFCSWCGKPCKEATISGGRPSVNAGISILLCRKCWENQAEIWGTGRFMAEPSLWDKIRRIRKEEVKE